MTGNHGRKMSYSALVITGNKRGLAGTALAKASLGNAAVRKVSYVLYRTPDLCLRPPVSSLFYPASGLIFEFLTW